MRFLTSLVLALVLLIAAGLLFIFSGIYNVAASDPDLGVVAWTLATAQDRSVEWHADAYTLPTAISEATLARGFEHYDEMCVSCHGAPGVEASEVGKGLNPAPPDLTEAPEDFEAGEVFWVVKHGIKMTGMPAFGGSHSDDDIRAIVAFVAQLPAMTAEDYHARDEALEGMEGGHEHGDEHADEGLMDHQESEREGQAEADSSG